MYSPMDRNYHRLQLYEQRLNEVEDSQDLDKNSPIKNLLIKKNKPPGGNDEHPVINCTTDFLSRPSSSNITLRNFVKPGLKNRILKK